jgi:hypothetical protein
VSTADLLEKVTNVRLDVRAIERSEVPVADRCHALLDLMDEVKAEKDPQARSWFESVLHEEARPFLEDWPPATSGNPYERAQRRLYTEGYSCCPNCLSSVATADDFARWQRERDARIAELELRERAVLVEHA